MRIITFLLLLGFVCVTTAQNYVLRSVVLDEGGGKINSTGYIVNLSFCQPIASSQLSNSNYHAFLGFLSVSHSWTGAYPGIEQKEIEMQAFLSAFSLAQNYPNPFNRHTVIRYSLPIETDVNLRVINSAGRVIRTLVSEKQQPGQYNVTWNLNGVSQSQLANGIYFYRLEAGNFTSTKKMILTK
jgi:hypothetical protein